MKSKDIKRLIALLLCAIMMLSGFVVWGDTLDDYMENNTMSNPTISVDISEFGDVPEDPPPLVIWGSPVVDDRNDLTYSVDISEFRDVPEDHLPIVVWGSPVDDRNESVYTVDISEFRDVPEDQQPLVIWGHLVDDVADISELAYVDEDELSEFSEPLTMLPTLTASIASRTSTSVTIHGNITSTGGAPITARGFWIRRANESVHREYLVNTTSNSFSRTISGLQPNTQYVIRAIARNGGSGSGQSNPPITFTTPAAATTPSAPLGFNATPGDRHVTLNWSAPSTNGGATIIRYEVSSNGGSTWVTVSGGANARNHTFTGLTNGMSHTFRVRAVNSVGAGAQSSVTATPVGLPTLTGSFSALTSTSVTLQGNITNTGGAPITARGFWIRRADNPQEQEWLVNTTANSFSRTITGLQPNTTYVARAIARNVNASWPTGQSNQITFTTPAASTAAVTFHAGNGGLIRDANGNLTPSITVNVPRGGRLIDVIPSLPVAIMGSHVHTGWADAPMDTPTDDTIITYYGTPDNPTEAYTKVDAEMDYEAHEWLTDTNFEYFASNDFDITDFVDFEPHNTGNAITLYSVITEDITAHPSWQLVTLRFNSNHSNAFPGQQSQLRWAGGIVGAHGQLNPLPATPIRHCSPAYSFVGWFNTYEETGGARLGVGSSIPIPNLTINPQAQFQYWARWAPRMTNVIFNANGGHFGYDGGPTPTTRHSWQAGTTVTAFPTPVAPSGLVLTGWYTARTGGTRVEFPFTVPTLDNNMVEYFARWGTPQGISVSVVDGDGRPISGARVQLVRFIGATYNSWSQRLVTDSSGIVSFQNLNSGRYAVNVTHQNFASTGVTSYEIGELNANQMYNVSITMNELNSTFRRIGDRWSPVLQDMGTPANPAYHISSVYGWRTFRGNAGPRWDLHNGIDISNRNFGSRIYSAFQGEVVQIFPNTDSRGHGVTIRYGDEFSDTRFYVRYMHMEFPPRLGGGSQNDANRLRVNMQVNAGAHIGSVGGSGYGSATTFSPHLHIDVHRHTGSTRFSGSSFTHTIDPRAFFPENFVAPWGGYNTITRRPQ